MHQKILVKVWAEDQDSARSEVETVIEESVQDGNSEGWDYSDDVVHISKEILKSEYGLKTFPELEKKYKAYTQDNYDRYKEEIKNSLIVLLAPAFLTKTEAPLYINVEDEAFKKHLEKLLKQKKDIKRPDSFEDILKIFQDIVIDFAEQKTGDWYPLFRLKQLNKLADCMAYPSDTNHTFQCTDNHYAELSDNAKEEGMFPFYFICDRHY